MTIKEAQKIHCIGIGGIGVSALARLWRAQGKQVSGSDAEESEITQALEKQGITMMMNGQGQSLTNKGLSLSADLVVYSDAVPEDHPERVAARARGVSEMSYAQALGEVSRQYRTIVVTGTHGKSTTTALLGLMLEAAGMDPLVIVGTKVPQWGNMNIRIPRMPSAANSANDSRHLRGEAHSRYPLFVVEGDDYRDHFLELAPHAVVITSIEWDHPDYFRDLDHTVESFRKLVEKVPEGGFTVINEDDPGCRQLFSMCHPRPGSPFSRGRIHNQPKVLDPRFRGGDMEGGGDNGGVRWITYGRSSAVFDPLPLKLPGEFNRYNATAAATASMALGVPREVTEKVTREFKGVWRRFEVVGTLPPPLTPPRAGGETKTISSPFQGEVRRGPITIVSDYGHHPTAIRATMKAAREAYPGWRIVLVYQPHQHSRTKHLFKDFVEALSAKGGSASGGKDVADLTILSEIYAVKGRMEDHDVSSRDLLEAIKSNNLITQSLNNSVFYGGDLGETKRVVLEQAQAGDVIIFMGAGDIDSLARQLVHNTRNT